MSLSWSRRKARLGVLLDTESEDEQAVALDRLLHGQSVIGRTSKTNEIDAIRFQDKDLHVLGGLERGQFGTVDVVKCTLNGHVYVRKSTEKALALRARDQCSPQFERDILLQALRTDSPWAPHLFCAYQTSTHLNLVMEYVDGGNLWDVLESSPFDGRIPEKDIMWWAPQIVSAIHWCHTQGFVHRDVKPHNFVLDSHAHLRLIDFGTAAPLLSPEPDGTRLLPRNYCLVPCGTCDYISPEILQAHERALLALEFEGESQLMPMGDERDVYGLETDWWSMGSMLYEMAYGVTPFFAEDIKRTYSKIMDHARSLRFASSISHEFQGLLRRLLTDAEFRLGRRNVTEILDHPVFTDVVWDELSTRNHGASVFSFLITLPEKAPNTLHLPQFTYSGPDADITGAHKDETSENQSQAFAFSALFQSSPVSGVQVSMSLPSPPNLHMSVSSRSSVIIGFSWGPSLNSVSATNLSLPTDILPTPRALRLPSPQLMSTPLLSTTSHQSPPFVTPIRPHLLTPHGTLPRTSTVRRAFTRPISDREAMKQLVDCVGMSARKRVLESGRKPRVLNAFNTSRSGTLRKELRFLPPANITAQSRSYSFDLSISSGAEDTDSDIPLSPSPSPRPGSAMSMLSRRSGTPTITGTFSQRMSTSASIIKHPSINKGSGTSRRRSSFTESLVTSPSLEDSTFQKLEDQYAVIMGNIEDIEQRLEKLLAS